MLSRASSSFKGKGEEGSGFTEFTERVVSALAALLGHLPATLGSTEADAGHLQHPDDRAEVRRRLDLHLSARWPVYVAEYRMRCADGSYLWILARDPRLPEDQYQALLEGAREKGFPVDELKRNRDLVPASPAPVEG